MKASRNNYNYFEMKASSFKYLGETGEWRGTIFIDIITSLDLDEKIILLSYKGDEIVGAPLLSVHFI